MTVPRVAIAGGGAVTALGLGLKPLEEALRTNASGLHDCPRLAGKGYQSTVGGFVPEDVWAQLRERAPSCADTPAFLLADAALRETQSGDEVKSLLAALPASRRGLVLSTTKGEITALERIFHQQPCPVKAQRHLFPALLAEDLAAAHQVGGPVRCVSAACISGLLAIQQGARLIQDDQADLVFVVGVDLVSEFVLAGFTSLKSLEPGGCRPFDAERKGLSLGEGAGAVALVRHGARPSPAAASPDGTRALRCADAGRLSAMAAPEDGRAPHGGPALVVRGWGSSNDANHLTGPSRDGSGLALAMRRALQQAGLSPEAVDWVHTHGTGTPYNDAMEGKALQEVFGERVPPFCSSKGVLGHTLGAAGVLETLVCLGAARAQVFPGTPGLRRPDPALPASLLQTPRPAQRLQVMLKLSAGFGGTNAALALGWEAGL